MKLFIPKTWLRSIWQKITYWQPMLDVPIYGRIATLELFRPHVSIIFWCMQSLLCSIIMMILMSLLFLSFYNCNRVRHKIFYSSRLKDTSSVFFNGMQRILKLLQGLHVKLKRLFRFCSFIYNVTFASFGSTM